MHRVIGHSQPDLQRRPLTQKDTPTGTKISNGRNYIVENRIIMKQALLRGIDGVNLISYTKIILIEKTNEMQVTNLDVSEFRRQSVCLDLISYKGHLYSLLCVSLRDLKLSVPSLPARMPFQTPTLVQISRTPDT